MEFLIGIGCGIIISLIYSFGPAFFSLLQTSVHYGFRSALPFPFGVNFSDITTVCLLLTVLSEVDMLSILHNPWVACVGGVMLLSFAVYFYTRKPQSAEVSGSVMTFRTPGTPKPMAVWFRGFIINFCNPIIWIYWLSIIALAQGSIGVHSHRLPIFFAGVLMTTLGLDVLKCKLASLLQRFLTARVLNIFNKVVGTILVAFAVYLVVSLLVRKG
ncbi:MAG: LysE family transporter [Bacteroidales bacterium]|nr:LysE family transporter [Bacteroidales bacterium]